MECYTGTAESRHHKASNRAKVNRTNIFEYAELECRVARCLESLKANEYYSQDEMREKFSP